MSKNIFKTVSNFLVQLTADVEQETKTAEVKANEIKLENGTSINVEGELSNGSIVTFNDNGNISPIKDGEYRLSDGSLLRCEKGIITEYVPKKADEQKPAEQTQQTKDSKVDDKKDNKEAELLKKSISDLQLKLNELSGKIESQEKENTQLKADLKKIGDQPGDKPLNPTDQAEASKALPTDPYEKDRMFNKLAEERLVSMKKKK